jgi:large subunit ribosomal protein L13
MTTRISKLLMGKHKPTYIPTKDDGDFVVVVNCFHAHLTDNQPRRTHVKDRFKTKLYRRHTGWPGGLKEVKAYDWRMRRPEFLIEHAVKGQLSKNRFRKSRLSRLLCYPGPVHPWTSVFPDHPELRWQEDDIEEIDESKYPDLEFEDGWVYDTLNMKRYQEIDGIIMEEDLPRYVPGYTVEPHKYPTSSYFDTREIDDLKKIEVSMREEKEQQLQERLASLRSQIGDEAPVDIRHVD